MSKPTPSLAIVVIPFLLGFSGMFALAAAILSIPVAIVMAFFVPDLRTAMIDWVTDPFLILVIIVAVLLNRKKS